MVGKGSCDLKVDRESICGLISRSLPYIPSITEFAVAVVFENRSCQAVISDKGVFNFEDNATYSPICVNSFHMYLFK